MSATKPTNLAARMGRWSADHWKTATFGWLAFVVVAFALGDGRHEDDRPEHGRAGRVRPHGQDPRRRLQAARRRERPRSRAARFATTDPAFTAAVDDVVAGSPSSTSSRTSVAVTGNAARSPRTGARRWSSSRSAATPTRRPTKIDPVLAQVDAAQKAHPQLFIGEFGDASAVKAVETAFAEDLGKAGLLSLPITLIILVIAFGALVAAGIPLLLALTAVFATFGVVAATSHVVPMANEAGALVLLIGLAVGVDYSLFYLKREREERAAGRSERAALEAAAATSGRSVLDLRPDRDDGDGRHVPDRRPDLRLVRDRDDHGRRDRDARLADRAARPAVEARRQGRPGPHPARRPPAPRRRRGPDLGRDRRPRPAPAAAVGRPRRRAAGGARGSGAPAPHGASRAPTRSRSTSRPCRRTTGCSRRSPARPCRPTWSSRRRT